MGAGAWVGGGTISETDLVRSWALGGEPEPEPEPEAKEKEGRAPETELSARDRNCSDQLKPCWSAREFA